VAAAGRARDPAEEGADGLLQADTRADHNVQGAEDRRALRKCLGRSMARVKREPRGFVLATSTHNRTACQAVLKNNVDVLNSGERTGSRVKLMNTMMQLRKCCNHPYLFDGVEDKTLDPFGDHLVTHSGKLVLLDKLLPRLQSKGSRVLIFSQMVRGFTFCNCKFCIVF
jgi:hypothetical protein